MTSYTREFDRQELERRNERIRALYIAGWSVQHLGRDFGITERTVQRICETIDPSEPRGDRQDGARRPRVYFIQDGDAVKIGTTFNNPRARLTSLQTGNPRTLRLRLVLEGNLERELHERFAHLHLRGEWFTVDADLEAFMSSDEVRSL